MYYRIFNPERSALLLCVFGTYISLPAQGFAIVSSDVKAEIEKLYSHLEITVSTPDDYKAFRLDEDKKEQAKKDAIEASKKQAELAAKEEAKLLKEKDKKAKKAEKVKADEASNALGKAQEAEKKVMAEVEARQVRVSSSSSVPPSHLPSYEKVKGANK